MKLQGRVLIALIVVFFCTDARCGSPNASWKIGDMWNLQVEVPGKTNYIVHAIIGGVETVDGQACWQVTFLPGNGAPADLKDKRHRVIVNQKTGQPVRAFKVADKQGVTVEKAGAGTFITGLPNGIPLELFNVSDLPTGKAVIAGTTRSVEVRKQEMGSHFFLEMTLFDNDVEQWTIRQQWAPGEKWWHTYERKVKGEKTLSARRLNAPPLKKELAAKKDQDPAILARRFPLRMDPKLRTKVPAVGANMQLAELLESLRSATGLNMTLADNLTYHDPKIGEVKMPAATAWMVMEMIAQRDLDDGRWMKTEDGYRLEGISRALRPPRNFAWLWALASVGGVLIIAGAIIVYRGRVKKPAAVASKG